jgi:pyruvate/2-oxoglutarate dehydrogenase complex dihydrolipoamide dehydrogenase (E3) component
MRTEHCDVLIIGGGPGGISHKRTGQPSTGPSLPAIIETDADAFLIGLVLRNFVA